MTRDARKFLAFSYALRGGQATAGNADNADFEDAIGSFSK
jgi:hypothetical protein